MPSPPQGRLTPRGPICCSAWPTSTTRGIISPKPPPLRARPIAARWPSFERRNSVHDPAEHERFVSRADRGVRPGLFAAARRRRSRDRAARVHRRPATVGNDVDRADLGQPFSVLRRRRVTAGTARLSGDPGPARPRRTARGLHLPDLTPKSSASSPAVTKRQLRDAAMPARRARIGDKMPDNYVHLGLLATSFPRAVFIHCRRDLRDVAVSCWMTGFRSVRWTNDVAAHRVAIPAVRPADEPLADRLARHDSPRRLRGNGRRPRRRGAGACSRPADSSGSPPASSFTVNTPAGPHRQLQSRCGSRSIAARSAAGKTTKPSWPISSRPCERPGPPRRYFEAPRGWEPAARRQMAAGVSPE